ncbi:trimethyllysine dioxygenase, mitochondrial-like [Pieris napi]|uniref:trimethyllysine dioxygenase, mitochondrial-like n=1 Tax=Pieris napi TaxID=78633 RepID=UPI001FBAFF98|nr:trimethyllysine dioxygenase, mitochondrial-like [Pieris napi]
MRILGIKNAKIDDTTLEVHFENDMVVCFEDCWLRDHCRCSKCFVMNTNLRANHLIELPDVTMKSVTVNGSELQLTWSDEHESIYDAEFLAEFEMKSWVNRRRINHVIWRGDEIAHKVARIPVDKFLKTKQGAKAIFQSILDYGVAFIEEVEPTLDGTAVVAEALGGIQQTLFGGMWDIKVDESLNDTAFMSIPLPQHTDLSSFTDPAGLQLLHSLEHTNGEGGETVLVDGFYAAAKLKEEHPRDYDFLTKFPVEAEYKFNGHSFRHAAPAIELDMITNDVRQIRFNSYDRSPMAFANGEDCRTYYRSLKHFASSIENKKNHWQFKLKPGVVMVFDNFRLLHGRTGFTGRRVLGGTYVSRTNWMDKARVLELIH